MIETESIYKKLDDQGRIILPKEWRKGVEEVKLIQMGDRLIIRPKKKGKLSDIPEFEVDLKSPLDDWHAVKDELMGYDEIYGR